MKQKFHVPILVGLASFLFLLNLGGYDLWPPDEPRFAQVAREMLTTGDYLAPHINGQPYTEKPPVLFWLTALVSKPFGDVTEFSARLPLAIGGILTVLFTYFLAQSLYGTRVAFWAALILMTTHRFWWQARFGQIDMVMTTFLTSALLCFWQWHRHRRTTALVGFYLSLAFAVLTKGPPGLVFPLLMVITFYWKRKPDRKALQLGLGMSFVALLVATWLIPARMAISVERGVDTSDGIAANLFRQTIGRFFLGISHAKWPWFYIEQLPVELLPWAVFLPWTAYWVWKNRKEGEEMRLLLCWTLPAFIFFSACIGKRSIYILPLYPVFAIWLSRSILSLLDSDRLRWKRNTGLVWSAALVIIAIVPLVLFSGPYKEYWNNALWIVSLGIGACGIHALYVALRTDGRQLHWSMVAHTVVLFSLCSLFIFPAINPYKSARDYCAPLRSLSEQGTEYNLYSLGFSREEYVFYAKHFHVPVLCELLAIPEMESLSIYEQARLQSKMQRDIQKAVRDIPIVSMASVTEEEIEALRNAVNAYQGPDEGQAQNVAAYEKAVTTRLQQLFQSMNNESSSLIMVMEDDWRWVLAMSPAGRQYALLKDTNVGSRKVLLLANTSAANAIQTLNNPVETIPKSSP